MASEKSREVYQALKNKGFPEEFCKEVAYKYMNTDFTANRMLGYLYGISQTSVEEIVDEMFAIISDRDRIVEKHKSEHAQARINQIYGDGLK
jgi:predicted RecB family nuclease